MPRRTQLTLRLAKRSTHRTKRTHEKTTRRARRLSPTSGLNLYRDCPRCFWLQYNRDIHRPRGIFPSLPGGMDLVIKDYFDKYRGALPPELVGKVTGVLVPDKRKVDTWRNWRTGLEYRDMERNATLFGALDDCLVDGDKYLPLDYKTKGSAPRPGDSERYYQTQLDTYALMLMENGHPVGDHAYLVYYYPTSVGANGAVTFAVHPVRVDVDPERARALFAAAVDALEGPVPPHHTRCEYCSWGQALNGEFD